MNSTTTIFEKISKVGAITPTTLKGLPGMSSLEIAEITGKRHDHVLRGIRRVLKEIAPLLGQCQYVETQAPDGYGRLQPLVVLDKELTFTVLTGYSASLRLLVTRRWLELEGSSFARLSVQAAVVHLIEREKDNRQYALHSIKKGPRRPLNAAERERRYLNRLAYRNSQKGM